MLKSKMIRVTSGCRLRYPPTLELVFSIPSLSRIDSALKAHVGMPFFSAALGRIDLSFGGAPAVPLAGIAAFPTASAERQHSAAIAVAALLPRPAMPFHATPPCSASCGPRLAVPSWLAGQVQDQQP